MKRSGTGGELGFSLVEALIAMTIFGVGILAAGTMQLTSLRANAKAFLISEGTLLTKSKLEELMALDYAAAALLDRDGDGEKGLRDRTFGTGAPEDADFEEVSADGRFRIYWNVAQNCPAPRMKTIGVVGRWQEKGEWKQTVLECIRSAAI